MTQHSAPDYHFSAHAGRLPASPANRILDMAAEPGLISLAAGNPAPEAYPVEEIRRIAGEILDREPMAALPYSVPQGDPGLRTAVLDFLAGKFTPANGDGCIIVTGAQQGADLTARVLLDPGDTVLCEAPTFLGVMDAFRATGARLRGIPMAEDGIDLAALEAALREEKRVRLLYTIPNFQNPTGITLPAEKREALCRLAERYDFVILEDDPYGDLRFSGEALPPVKAFDREGRVLYMGSFSKILAPGGAHRLSGGSKTGHRPAHHPQERLRCPLKQPGAAHLQTISRGGGPGGPSGAAPGHLPGALRADAPGAGTGV